MVEGNTQHRYKAALTALEESSPGTKQQMYFGFLKKAASRFAGDAGAGDLTTCSRCGGPAAGTRRPPLCSFCRTKALAHSRKAAGRRRSVH